MDIRLAHKVLQLAHGADRIACTQQQLASELGTAREVVSRILSEFQRRGWIASVRGNIAITDRAALEKVVREHRDAHLVSTNRHRQTPMAGSVT
jgi:CRP/FNR family transcriptional regulator